MYCYYQSDSESVSITNDEHDYNQALLSKDNNNNRKLFIYTNGRHGIYFLIILFIIKVIF